MSCIDIHTHIMPPRLPDFKKMFGYGGFVQLDHGPCGANMVRDDGSFFRKVEPNCYEAEPRLRYCDELKIDQQVLSTIPVLFSYWTQPRDGLKVAQVINDHIAEVVAAHPRRFIGLGTLPMQAPDLAVNELRRCRDELGLRGIEIGSHINEWNLNAPEVFAVLEACQALDMAVFVHPWDMMGQSRMPDYWLPWLVGMPAESSLAICSLIFGGVLERLPGLRIAFAHGGGSFPATLGRIEHGHSVRPDLCAVDNPKSPRDYLDKIYVDSLVHDAATLRFLIATMGEDQICLGSDYPFPLGELASGELVRSMTDLRPDTTGKILGLNARRWLALAGQGEQS